MHPTDDSALLREYAEDHSDEAFAMLVTRHINLVYSVALRHVGDPHQAEDITQGVFILLAQKAVQLRHDKALSSWLFQATRLTASNFVRSETRRHHREQEAHMQSVLNESGSDLWRQIAPLLDDAVAGLSEIDRRAIVLRFYEGRNLREVGAVLGASEDAAEKRVNRAVEKLRTFFAKRGVTVGASGLAVVISANAVQAAPVGLAVTISSAAALAGTTVAATTIATVTKAIAMTAFQKTLITTTIAAAVGAGIYEARQASMLRTQIQTLQQQQWPLAAQNQQLQRERDDATNRLAMLQQASEHYSLISRRPWTTPLLRDTR
jgi:RNA polymerase sigma factor (sigma-70 family)